MPHYDAVCSECQRMIPKGATKQGNVIVMINHPAAGVFGDMKNWQSWYDPTTHYNCAGKGTEPEFIK